LLVYFGFGLLICLKLALGETGPLKINGITLPPFFHPLLPWALQAVTTLFLLLFLNRQIRAVGPLLLVFMAIVSLGAHLALVGMSTYAALKFLTSVFMAMDIDVSARIWLIRLTGMAVCLPIAWSIIALIRRRYDMKRISDQKLTVDSIWLFSTLSLCGQLVFYAGLAGWTGLSAFAAYMLIDRAFTKPLASAASARQGARLLLLRVFGFRRRTERLFDMLGLRWRYAGPVQLIAAPDLAGRLIDPGKFLDFLSRRLRKRFIIKGGDLDRQLAQVDLRPDADGRFRVNEFFCGNDTWRQVVTRLMTGSDLVAMDLRSFSFQRKGCVFELQTLLDTVPVARIVLLVDSTTDLSFLREILAECWRELKATSPNYMGSGTLTMLEIGRSNVVAVKALLGFAESVLYAPVPTMTPLARAEAI
jgi:hypothetical protein